MVNREDREETRGASKSTNDENNLRYEDDFSEIDPSTKDSTKPYILRGNILTRYSMYGKYCAVYRGYGDGNAALGEMVESLGGNAYPFRLSEGVKKLRKMFKSGGQRR